MFFSNNNFEHIYITYADMVYRICFLSLKNKTDAEDAVQEVFMKLLKNQAKIKDEHHLKYWLIRVTQNLCKDIIKKNNHCKNEYLFDIQDSKAYSENNNTSYVGEALEKLSQEYMLPIYLYYYEGYSYKEISTILKIPISTVKMRIHYAKKKLKLLIEEDTKNDRE